MLSPDDRFIMFSEYIMQAKVIVSLHGKSACRLHPAGTVAIAGIVKMALPRLDPRRYFEDGLPGAVGATWN
jgi:hypothetical protein